MIHVIAHRSETSSSSSFIPPVLPQTTRPTVSTNAYISEYSHTAAKHRLEKQKECFPPGCTGPAGGSGGCFVANQLGVLFFHLYLGRRDPGVLTFTDRRGPGLQRYQGHADTDPPALAAQ